MFCFFFRKRIDEFRRAFLFDSTLSDKKRGVCTLTEKERESRLPERKEVEWIETFGRAIVDGVVVVNRDDIEEADVEAQLPERSLLDVADAAARAAAAVRRAAEAEDAIGRGFFCFPPREKRKKKRRSEGDKKSSHG